MSTQSGWSHLLRQRGECEFGGTLYEPHRARALALPYMTCSLVFAALVIGWLAPATANAAPLMKEIQRLLASDGAYGDGYEFGWSVAVQGDTVVVGARQHGVVYVFLRVGDTWTEQARLTASDHTTYDLLGSSVAIDGDTIVAGAPQANTPYDDAAGAVYVYEKPAGGWVDMTETAKITCSTSVTSDQFGVSVALDGDTLAVGAYEAHVSSYHSGAAYIFVRSAGVWSQQVQLWSPRVNYAGFGYSVALSGDTAVIGAYGVSSAAGRAYLFVRSGDVWPLQATLQTSDAATYSYFGRSVAIDADTVLVGADGRDDVPNRPGSAYVFNRPAEGWTDMTETAKLMAGVATADKFGRSVTIHGDRMLVGDTYADGAGGAAYFFMLADGQWTLRAKLTAIYSYAYFGNSVAFDGNTAIVGNYFFEPWEDPYGAWRPRGAARMFDLRRIPADMNCDSLISFADINPFVLALGNQAAYEAAYPTCPWLNADINGDGVVSFADINPFVAALAGG